MTPRIIKFETEKGIFDFWDFPKEFFTKKYPENPHMANYKFHNQRKDFELKMMSHFELDFKQYAIEEYGLICESEQKEITDFSDNEIEAEFISRGGFIETSVLQNENIVNETFLSRFITIIDRGNDAEIEQALNSLEEKYRIK